MIDKKSDRQAVFLDLNQLQQRMKAQYINNPIFYFNAQGKALINCQRNNQSR